MLRPLSAREIHERVRGDLVPLDEAAEVMGTSVGAIRQAAWRERHGLPSRLGVPIVQPRGPRTARYVRKADLIRLASGTANPDAPDGPVAA